MGRRLHSYILVLTFVSTLAKDPELPLCPTNILQYFPQSLPMHCRMPPNAGNLQFPPLPMMPPPPPPSKKHSGTDKSTKKPIPIPFPPMMPGALPMPMMPMPMPGAMPGSMPGPAHKMPLIVMPFYSPDNSFKKPPHRPGFRKRKGFGKRKRFHDSDSSFGSDDSSHDVSFEDTDSSEDDIWRDHRKSGRRSGRNHNKRTSHKPKKQKEKRNLLTPILQYVTKDGYVIYEKKISKGEAKDWLHVKKEETDNKEHTQIKETKNEGERRKNEDKSAEEEVDYGNASIAEVNVKGNRSKENNIQIVTKKVPPKINHHSRKAKPAKRDPN